MQAIVEGWCGLIGVTDHQAIVIAIGIAAAVPFLLVAAVALHLVGRLLERLT